MLFIRASVFAAARLCASPSTQLSGTAAAVRAMKPTAATKRFMASKSEAPKFDPIMVKAYNAISENHRHERGPWTLMTNQVIAHTAGIDNPTILDIATGPGEPAKTIALALPKATIIASDVNEDMVAAAAKSAEGLSNFKTLVADAQDLSDVESESIDVVACCYGYMFPTDKPAALAESKRVLKPGGKLIATTWDRLDSIKICKDVMSHILGFDPPPPPINPLSLSEEGLFYNLVDDAGFENITQTTSTYPFNYGREKEFQFIVSTILLREKINELEEGGDADVWDRAKDAYLKNIDKYSEIDENGDMVIQENTFRLTIATKA